MAFHWDIRKNEGIVIFTAGKDYDVARDIAAVTAEGDEIYDAFDEQVLVICDMLLMPPMNMDGVVVGANKMSRGSNPLFQHAKIQEVVFVTTDKVFQLALKGMSSETFGKHELRVFDTVDAALEYAKS